MKKQIYFPLLITLVASLIFGVLPLGQLSRVYAAPDLITNSPTGDTGDWTNPTNAYADGTGYASITSGTPSANHTYSSYGFSLAGYNIDLVRVRYDAWCGGSTTPLSQTRYPAGDNDVSGTWTVTPATPTTRYDKVDETPADDNDFIACAGDLGYSYFSYTAFSIPGDATITNLTIYYRAQRGGVPTADASAAIKVGGTLYGDTDPGVNPATSFTTYSYTFTTNPQTDSAWTVADINGTGANPLQGFGINSTDSKPDTSVSQNYAVVNYFQLITDEQIRVDVTWDGGTSWSSQNVTALSGAEATYWYDVTSAIAWTPEKLNDTYFKVRVDAYTQGVASEVRLDWIPVEVTYSIPPPADISNDPSEWPIGLVVADSTYYTGLNNFTVTNNSAYPVTITISGDNMTGDGVTWFLSDNGEPGENIYALKAGLADTSYNITVPQSFANILVSPLAGESGTQQWGLQFLAPATFTDYGMSLSANVTLTATQAGG